MVWLKKFGTCSLCCPFLENPWQISIVKALMKFKKIEEHLNLQFPKGILPWNPFALNIHHSVKEDWCSSVHSLGTTGLPAPVQVLSLAHRPLSWASLPASPVSPPLGLMSTFGCSHTSLLTFAQASKGFHASMPLPEPFPQPGMLLPPSVL